MTWLALVGAGICEIFGVIGINGASSRKGWRYVAIMLVSFVCSFSLLSYAMTSIPMGTAYAVWTGIGTVGTALVGIVLLGEPATPVRLACIALIVAGIAGLKLTA